MKKLLTYLVFPFLICTSNSCAWIDSRIESKFEENVREGCAKIKKATSEAVDAAKDTIAIATINSVQSASADLSEFLSKSISDFEQKVSGLESRVDREIDTKIATVTNKSDSSMLLALIACLAGIVGTICSAYALFSLRDKVLRRKVIEYVNHSRELDDRIRMIADSVKQQSVAGLSMDDMKKEVRKCILSSDITDILISEIIHRSESRRNVPDENCPGVVQEEISQPPTANCVLYARNSSNSIFSDVSTVHQKGKTVYRLVLDRPDSLNATIELCTDKEDVVGRVLRFDNETLEPVCSVTRMSNSPQRIRVTKPGKAEKISGNEWKVTEKVEIELS